jgi:ABC-type bacteriocin/lantibiotic exporter with double-glycine peptidase domain
MLWKYVYNIFKKFIKDNPRYLFLNIFFFFVSLINSYYLPKYYGAVFDVFNKNLNAFLGMFFKIIIVKGIVYFISELQNYYVSIQRAGLEVSINKSLLDKIKNQYIESPNDVVIGEKVAAISEFQSILSDWYGYINDYIMSYILTIGFFIGYVSQYDYVMPLLVIGFLSLSFYLLFTNSNNCVDASSASSSTYLQKYQEVEDYLSNLMTIHTYNQFNEEHKRLKELSDNYQYYYNLNTKCSLKWSMLGTVMAGVFLLAVMYRSFSLLNKGTISKATFLSIYFIGSGILETLVFFSDTLHEMNRDYKLLQNIESTSKMELMAPPSEGKMPLEGTLVDRGEIGGHTSIGKNMILQCRGIFYKYSGSNEPIIRDFDLDIKRGERIALIGDIGTGKSTLIKIILGLLRPSSGELYINGVNYKSLPQSKIFKHFGYITQNPVLFNRSIFENIIFGNPDVSRTEVINLLEKFGLNTVFDKLENGIDTSVGKNGSKLSGGQRQIIWFLRIYLQNPEILLMDEPTASLNEETKEVLWGLIKKGFADKTIIMSSHDDFLIKLATRKVKMIQSE